VLSTTVRQRRTTRPRDLPQGEERLAVRWHKVQFSCRERPCPRKAFTEQIPDLPAGARVTGRLRRHVAGRVADGLAVSVAGDGLISWPISHAAWSCTPTLRWSSLTWWRCSASTRPAADDPPGCRTR
jgi:hypothetical protein